LVDGAVVRRFPIKKTGIFTGRSVLAARFSLLFRLLLVAQLRRAAVRWPAAACCRCAVALLWWCCDAQRCSMGPAGRRVDEGRGSLPNEHRDLIAGVKGDVYRNQVTGTAVHLAG
jgi:hypothetical protein